MQATQLKPDINVQISDVMRSMFHGRVPVVLDKIAPSVIAPSVREPADRSKPMAQDVAGWERIVLRRDGRRPLRFLGLLLWSMAQQTPRAGTVTLDLFLGSGGEIYAHGSITPSSVFPAREVMIGHRIDTVCAMEEFLSACSPEHCILAHPDTNLQQAYEQTEAGALLQKSYLDLVTKCFLHS